MGGVGRKIGIFGGTFNPVHMGHLLLAEEAREAMGLQEILFIPSYISYMKDQDAIAGAADRVAMTALAVEDNHYFRLSTIETDREDYSYTYKTLRELGRQNPDALLHLIIGADSLFQMEKWKEPEEIFGRCTVVVSVREGYNENVCRQKAEALRERFGADIRLLAGRMIEISATDIRQRLREGRSARYLLPDKVLSYIKEKGLYRPGESS